ncbi:hypothetical protein BD324DRAFT_620388 [Kockovaella imperatae]|uniref:WW domain-containing protein n=1 Tax=Kockovaella imperatae TaxID=4999 RepID=A0A1Y1UJS8_9TREE|nr:hypothetical protein BD324DRAFT_620388 [Kockovaella imperatae]ORX38308.1 hypothetical protein BD324DRAFT_620388 [Kockovaella imperatae]
MSGPPTYEAATADRHQPQLAVTNPQGQTTSPAAAANTSGNDHDLSRVRSNDTVSSVGSTFVDQIGEDGRRSMDDERRDLPPGWVRCFDPKTEHHFYVEEATRRSIWVHPYDDPTYLESLPDDHPANPNSPEAQRLRERAEEERKTEEFLRAEREGQQGDHSRTAANEASERGTPQGADKDAHRNWFQRQKDHLIGTKEERQKAKEERQRIKAEQKRKAKEEQVEYMKRRQELLKRQMNDPTIRRYYASDPYSYSAPSMAYSRAYGSPFGYGYGGGYGRRRYGYGGYGGYGLGMPMAAGLGGFGGGLLLGEAMGGEQR